MGWLAGMVTTTAALKREQHRHQQKERRDERRDYWRRRQINVNGRWVTPIPDNDLHGTLRGYNEFCCGCDLCSLAMRDYHRRRRETAKKTSTVTACATRSDASASDSAAVPSASAPAVPVQKSPDPVEFTGGSETASATRTPAAAPKPAPPKKKPAQQAAVDTTGVLDDPLPPFTPGARRHIECLAHLESVQNAYYRPQTVTSMPDGDQKRHHHNGTMIIVAGDGTILHVSSHDQSSDAPESLVEIHRPKRRTSGGSGNRLPTTMDELIRRCRQQGCEVVDNGGKHLKVLVPEGDPVPLPRTPSDWRSIPNAVSQLRSRGVDVRR